MHFTDECIKGVWKEISDSLSNIRHPDASYPEAWDLGRELLLYRFVQDIRRDCRDGRCSMPAYVAVSHLQTAGRHQRASPAEGPPTMSCR